MVRKIDARRIGGHKYSKWKYKGSHSKHAY